MTAAFLAAASCEKLNDGRSDHTFVVFSLGFNNLSSALKYDIEDIVNHSLSKNHKNRTLLIFSHHTKSGSNYSQEVSPVLTHVYKDKKDRIIRDTVLVMEPNTVSASSETIRTILEYTKEHYPAGRYGMLISSHGTGWAPENYCNYPERFDEIPENDFWQKRSLNRIMAAPLMDGTPDVKSIGVQNVTSKELIEFDITELAEDIPMKMDYIIFDACFMGGVEVAYELKDICDKIVFSQTEILADGMDYTTMLSYLFNGPEPDLKGLCDNYYKYYDSKNGIYRSATISLIDCRKLQGLARTCKEIFESQRADIAGIDDSQIQKYFRPEYKNIHGWFYDMESIITHGNATTEQREAFQKSLESCIMYKAATPRFMSSIQIHEHSGLSMYLPIKERTYLNNFYKTLKWNKDTGLVK
jgi:hypothetical protein